MDFFPFQLLTLLGFRKFQNCRPRIPFEKYKLHFSPTLGKPLRDHSKVWGCNVLLSMEGVRMLVHRRIPSPQSLFVSSWLYFLQYCTYVPTSVSLGPRLPIQSGCLNVPKCPLLHVRVCCFYACRVVQIYKQSKVKTISSESSFVFDGPVSTLQQQHHQPVTIL